MTGGDPRDVFEMIEDMQARLAVPMERK